MIPHDDPYQWDRPVMTCRCPNCGFMHEPFAPSKNSYVINTQEEPIIIQPIKNLNRHERRRLRKQERKK